MESTVYQKKGIHEKNVFRLPEDDIAEIIKYIKSKYGKYLKKGELRRARVLLEEVYLYLVKHMGDEGLSATVRCRKRLGI